MTTKVCATCCERKDISGFYKNKGMSDGYLKHCRVCHKKKRALRRDKDIAYMKEWHSKNKEAQKAYYDANREHYREYHREYAKNKRRTDPHYKLSQNLRSRLKAALKGVTKGKSVLELVGVPVEQLMEHLEAQFKDGMSWDNYGEWHVDHIKPLKLFDNPEDPEAWVPDNLQPLWASENVRKGSKFTENK